MSKPLSPKEISQILEAELSQFSLPSEPVKLYEPMQYILKLGGKRLRPLLALMSYNLFKDDVAEAVIPSLSIELFHNFSLIHDDIMDKAPVRRGQATVHIKWDDNVAILSGDGMLVKAYQMLEQISHDKLPQVLISYNKTALEVCEGQQFDMDFESRSLEVNPVSEAEYMNMIRLKTSVLFGFSLQLGGMLAGADNATTARMYNAGVHLGLAFQLQDDLLDLYGGDKFGKIPGGDIINAKKTFMLVKTLELANEDDFNLIIKTLEDNQMEGQQKVAIIAELYAKYQIAELVQKEIEKHLANFNHTLGEIGSGRSSVMLEFVNNLAHRTV